MVGCYIIYIILYIYIYYCKPLLIYQSIFATYQCCSCFHQEPLVTPRLFTLSFYSLAIAFHMHKNMTDELNLECIHFTLHNIIRQFSLFFFFFFLFCYVSVIFLYTAEHLWTFLSLFLLTSDFNHLNTFRF